MGSFVILCLFLSQWLKTWREVAHFHTIPLFGRIDIATALDGFRNQFLAPLFWIKCIRRWYGQFYWGLPTFGPGRGGGKDFQHPVFVSISFQVQRNTNYIDSNHKFSSCFFYWKSRVSRPLFFPHFRLKRCGTQCWYRSKSTTAELDMPT